MGFTSVDSSFPWLFEALHFFYLGIEGALTLPSAAGNAAPRATHCFNCWFWPSKAANGPVPGHKAELITNEQTH